LLWSGRLDGWQLSQKAYVFVANLKTVRKEVYYVTENYA